MSINFVYVDTKEGKYCAYPDVVSANQNLAGIGEGHLVVQFCPTRKSARELADIWNEQYRANGTYMFA